MVTLTVRDDSYCPSIERHVLLLLADLKHTESACVDTTQGFTLENISFFFSSRAPRDATLFGGLANTLRSA